MSAVDDQEQLDAANAAFWAELCGSYLASELGISDASAGSLAIFDRAYLGMYPYLERYVPWHNGERVLEIGLGYGTVGQLLAERGLDYHGLDISPGPVAMMARRLEMVNIEDAATRVTQGSALAIPHPDESFDVVVSIGCLHHTGDLARAIEEVRRVLRPGGQATVMVYNRYSYRRLVMLPLRMFFSGVAHNTARRSAMVRAAYDTDTLGSAAPATEFVSVSGVRRLFAGFSDVGVRRENVDNCVLSVRGRRLLTISRTPFLGNLGRVAGLDLYVIAVK